MATLVLMAPQTGRGLSMPTATPSERHAHHAGRDGTNERKIDGDVKRACACVHKHNQPANAITP